MVDRREARIAVAPFVRGAIVDPDPAPRRDRPAAIGERTKAPAARGRERARRVDASVIVPPIDARGNDRTRRRDDDPDREAAPGPPAHGLRHDACAGDAVAKQALVVEEDGNRRLGGRGGRGRCREQEEGEEIEARHSTSMVKVNLVSSTVDDTSIRPPWARAISEAM